MLYVLFVLIIFYLFFSGFFVEDEEPGEGEYHLWYYRPEPDFSGWNVWLWNPDDASAWNSVYPVTTEGKRALFVLSAANLPVPPGREFGFVFRKGEWEEKDGGDRFWKEGFGAQIYVVAGEKEVFLRKPRSVVSSIRNAFLDSKRMIQLHLPYAVQQENLKLRDFSVVRANGHKIAVDSYVIRNSGLEIEIFLGEALSLKEKDLCDTKVGLRGFNSVYLQLRGVYYEPEYAYTDELGMIIKGQEITFRAFAPGVKSLELLVFDGVEGPETEILPMKEKRTGLYEIKLPEEAYLGKYYKYRAIGTDFPGLKQRDVLDPYSKCHTHRFGRSHIFRDRTRVAKGPSFPREEAVIYELHIRDFSICENSGMKHKGKYLCLAETDTTLVGDSEIRTGVAHLRELGVNTVHLLPVFDFDHDDDSSEYNWGYMPFHFFSPSGWYASDPRSTARVHELKKAIDSLHRQGFKVVLDVVYNHTAEGADMAVNFNGLAPGYYYRRTHEGHYFNGSGCGNEFKSESAMGRKFIIDSLKYWLHEYKVDGFRFDLMGLIDYDTWLEMERELTRQYPEILLYGEPWAAGGAGVAITGKGAQRGRLISVFSDHFRDAIRGDNSAQGRGFLQAGLNADKIRHGLIGAILDFADQPGETVNYVACHDNYTLADKLVASTAGDDFFTPERLLHMEEMCALILFVSQGIPFLHAGQEFRRSKSFDHNSYKSPDSINQIDWSLKKTNNRLFAFYRDLIGLRAQHRLFRMNSRKQVLENISFLNGEYNLPDGVVAMTIAGNGLLDSFSEVFCAFNSGRNTFELPLKTNGDDWRVVVREGQVFLRLSEMPLVSGSKLVLEPVSYVVLAKINKK
jgi:pullulanase